MIQQLAQNNPGLAQALAANPEALLDLLGGEVGEDGEPIPPGAQVLSVTPEERDAIARVGHFRYLPSRTPSELSYSWRLLAFLDRLSLRRILHAERMKNWQRISSLKAGSRMITLLQVRRSSGSTIGFYICVFSFSRGMCGQKMNEQVDNVML
jgi:hypothetical protein